MYNGCFTERDNSTKLIQEQVVLHTKVDAQLDLCEIEDREFDRLMGRTASCSEEELKQNLPNVTKQDIDEEMTKLINFSDEQNRPQNSKLMPIVINLKREKEKRLLPPPPVKKPEVFKEPIRDRNKK